MNPIEKFWGWLRKKLRAADMKDMQARRPVLGKMAYRARIRSICKSRQAQRVAASYTLGLRKVCQQVINKEGAASKDLKTY